jgi:hypothetical protein
MSCERDGDLLWAVSIWSNPHSIAKLISSAVFSNGCPEDPNPTPGSLWPSFNLNSVQGIFAVLYMGKREQMSR